MVTDKDADSAADVAREIGGQAQRLDVSSEKDWEALAEVWPECDVVVNNQASPDLRRPCVPMIRRMPASRTGARYMRSILTGLFSDAVIHRRSGQVHEVLRIGAKMTLVGASDDARTE
jgi:hypothetical protein